MYNILLGYGLTVDDCDETGMTPLMYAFKSGVAEGIPWLLKHGADPDRKDKQGRSARDYANPKRKPRSDRILKDDARLYSA